MTEYARGQQVSADAPSAYDADVSAAQTTAQSYISQGIPYNLTIVPFQDPGAAIRANAVSEFETAKGELEAAASTCASEVRAGCADAPEEPGWLESGFKFVGGVLMGAGEAVWDLVKLTAVIPGSPMFMYEMNKTLSDLASGEMTPEEWAAKQQLTIDQAVATFEALKDDPIEFGKNVGKGMLDWDTWADDPARALGHLVPDAIAAVATGGTAAAATRGARGLTDVVDALADVGRLDGPGDGLDGGRGDLGELAGTSGLDDLARQSGPGGGPAAVPSLDDVRSWLPEVNNLINGDPSNMGARGVNCGECALAVHQRLEGSTDAVAGLTTRSTPEMESATGRVQTQMTPAEIADHLRAEGPGAHAVVGIDRSQGAGHWFNAYFDGDKVVAIDAQTGQILDWPPDMGGPGVSVTNWDVGVKP